MDFSYFSVVKIYIFQLQFFTKWKCAFTQHERKKEYARNHSSLLVIIANLKVKWVQL